MSKQLLIENKFNTHSLTLCEGVEGKSKRPGCLGTLKGPCADFLNPTRNNNLYVRKLWENVFKDPLVVEALEDRVLIGELDHPGDRLETKATLAAIVMTDYEFDDKNGVLNGTFDILDTPNGRTLKSLLDYGCRVGVSSRGEGDVTTEDGVDRVDEETYYFVAFDAVVLPAVKKAKPTLQESLKRESLKESIKDQINAATTKGELDLIKKVLIATQLPEIDSLTESINIKSKELEGINDSSNLMEDLERSTTKINELIEENKKLSREVTDCKSRIKRFIESRLRINDKLDQKTKELESLSSEYTDMVFKLGATTRKMESLETQMSESRDTIRRLNEQLRTTGSKNSQNESRISSLEESLKRSQESVQSKNRTISRLRKEIDVIKASSSQELNESRQREAKAVSEVREVKTSLNESKKINKSILEDYAIKRSKESGLDEGIVLGRIKSGMVTKDIDSIILEELDRRDRYRKLPIGNDPLITALSEGATITLGSENEESSQTIQFMEECYHHRKG